MGASTPQRNDASSRGHAHASGPCAPRSPPHQASHNAREWRGTRGERGERASRALNSIISMRWNSSLAPSRDICCGVKERLRLRASCAISCASRPSCCGNGEPGGSKDIAWRHQKRGPPPKLQLYNQRKMHRSLQDAFFQLLIVRYLKITPLGKPWRKITQDNFLRSG